MRKKTESKGRFFNEETVFGLVEDYQKIKEQKKMYFHHPDE